MGFWQANGPRMKAASAVWVFCNKQAPIQGFLREGFQNFAFSFGFVMVATCYCQPMFVEWLPKQKSHCAEMRPLGSQKALAMLNIHRV